VQSPVSVTFDDTGTLFVGTANSLVAKLEVDPTQLEGYRFAGEGVTDIDGTVRKLAWVERAGLVALLKDNGSGSSYIATIDPAGSFRRTGTFETLPLDSGIENCTWHRVQVVGTIPAGTSLRLESWTSPTTDFSLAPVSTSIAAGADNPDWLIQSSPGQFLKLRFTLRSGGEVSPQIHALKVYFPRESYLEYLPAVFQDDEESRRFLDRFLSIFQTSFEAFDQKIDTLWELFDPFSISDKYFPWLAGILALPMDPEMPIEQKRKLLKSAFQTYLLRGTVRGFEKVIQDYTGIASVRVVEHFRLRNWPFLALTADLDGGSRLWSRNFYQRLQVGVNSRLGSFKLTSSPEPTMEPFDWGANQFTIFFPANPRTVAATSASIKQVVEREKPAHALANLCPVFPRMRVGVQATLGVDAVLGEVLPMVLGKTGTLGYDSVLSRSHMESEIRSLGVNPHPSIGVDARLL
jgi:phage tail-like protein